MCQDDRFTIKEIKHGDKLWSLLCPFAVSRQVRKELGIAISSDENYTWLFAFDHSNNVAAIAAVEFCNGSRAIFRHAYVVKEYRGSGLYKRLLELREQLAKGKRAIITVNHDILATVLSEGYMEIGKRGKYTTVEKQL